MFETPIEWNAPDKFPDLSKFKHVAIDLETRDPDLKSKGSGAVRGNGEIIGIALAVNEGGFKWSGYYPIAHRAGNLDKGMVMGYINFSQCHVRCQLASSSGDRD